MRFRWSIILLGVLLLMAGCAKKEPVRESRTMMGTVVTISVFDTDKTDEQIHRAINRAYQEFERIDTLMWDEASGSDIRKISENAGSRSATITDETFQVIMEALKLFDKTQEAFDIRVGPLIELWGFTTDHPAVPDSAALGETMELVSGGGIFVAGQSIMLGKAGMELDLSGLAKGYAVEQAAKVLADQGIQSAIVEAGGDLKVLGTRDDKGTRWHIALRHPRQRDAYWGIVDILDGAVATSGDYENYFEQDGKRYHHIMNPKTGYPADECVSVTVWGDHALRCDALATALFILGPEAGMEVLEEYFKDYEALFIVQEDGELSTVMTPGFEEVFRPGEE
jgi:thiamine biosynthesis lipoprotein